MNKEKIVFLDLDGVIRDFVQGVIEKFNLSISHKDVSSWDYFTKDLKLPNFWGELDYDFWLKLKFTKDAEKILEIVEPYKPVVLTSPIYDSAGATQQWVRTNLPEYFKEGRYLIGPAKWACAGENKALIDDAEHNIDNFKKYGGYSILWPASWNRGREWFVNENLYTDRFKLLEANLTVFKEMINES